MYSARELWDHILELVYSKGLKQAEAAKKMDINYNTWRAWVDIPRYPDICSLAKISEFFNMPTDSLIGIQISKTDDISPSFGYLSDKSKEIVNSIIKALYIQENITIKTPD